MLNGVLSDLVKDDSRECSGVFVDRMGDMIANRLSLSILIGRDIDGFGFLGKRFDLLHDCLVTLFNLVVREKALPLYLDSKVVLGKIADMPLGGDHFILFAQKIFDGFSLGR